MVDLSSISEALGALKALKDIALGVISTRDADLLAGKVREFNDKLIEAQTAIIAVNDERTALIQRVGAAEKELAELKDWNADKENYELKRVSHFGSLAYVLKESVEGAGPAHALCANCYEHNKKRLLQGTPKVEVGRRMFECQDCHARVAVDGAVLQG